MGVGLKRPPAEPCGEQSNFHFYISFVRELINPVLVSAAEGRAAALRRSVSSHGLGGILTLTALISAHPPKIGHRLHCDTEASLSGETAKFISALKKRKKI